MYTIKTMVVLSVAFWLGSGKLTAQNPGGTAPTPEATSPASQPPKPPLKPLKITLSDDGSRYIQITGNVQIWNRYNQNNPGTLVAGPNGGVPQSNSFDISIRRARFQIFGPLSNRAFFYVQIGQNNFNYASPRKAGFFLHDALGEIKLLDKVLRPAEEGGRPASNASLSIGTGLTAWSGPARFSSPAVGAIMGLDAPIYQQTTNDISDQFLRRLSTYIKGKIGRFDYRLALSKPMSLTQVTGFSNLDPRSVSDSVASFSLNPPKMMTHGYFQWQFLDIESNLLPYNPGTYLGTKKILNVGFGFQTQADAMWYLKQGTAGKKDTVSTKMLLLSGDIFYDAPVGQKGMALSLYGNYMYCDFGPNFVRYLGVDNIAVGIQQNSAKSLISANSGSAFPMLGTGSIVYAQAGFKLPNDLLGSFGTLMPYASIQYNKLKRLNDAAVIFDAGVNWLINGHNAKLTLGLQNRPVFEVQNGSYNATSRKSMFVAQYQAAF